jgi:apolipoprotein D and lipocalin family protein
MTIGWELWQGTRNYSILNKTIYYRIPYPAEERPSSQFGLDLRKKGGRMKTKRFLVALVAVLMLPSCTKVPTGLHPVDGFEADRYLGKWYEIARLDHSFERNLSNVTAEYSWREGGGINVVNRGFDQRKGKWREAKGVARFIGDKNLGSLKVSFFGPFWGGYHVIALDKQDYRYSMVAGPNRSYLWILSRDKTLDETVVSALVSEAERLGFEGKELIYVEHNKSDN